MIAAESGFERHASHHRRLQPPHPITELRRLSMSLRSPDFMTTAEGTEPTWPRLRTHKPSSSVRRFVIHGLRRETGDGGQPVLADGGAVRAAEAAPARQGARRAEGGPRKTLYNRFVRWAEKGYWVSIFEALADEGGPPSQAMIDSSAVRAHRSASGGKGGSARKPSAARAAGGRQRSARLATGGAARSG